MKSLNELMWRFPMSIAARWRRLSRGARVAIVLYQSVTVGGSLWLTWAWVGVAGWTDLLGAAGLLLFFFEVTFASVWAVLSTRALKHPEPVLTRPGEDTPPSTARRESVHGIVSLFVGLLLLRAAPIPLAWLFPEAEWVIRFENAFDSDLKGVDVIASKRPHDCEFLTAPVGSKHCHYERVIERFRVRRNGSAYVKSYDDGKTWLPAEPADKGFVALGWIRVND